MDFGTPVDVGLAFVILRGPPAASMICGVFLGQNVGTCLFGFRDTCGRGSSFRDFARASGGLNDMWSVFGTECWDMLVWISGHL